MLIIGPFGILDLILIWEHIKKEEVGEQSMSTIKFLLDKPIPLELAKKYQSSK